MFEVENLFIEWLNSGEKIVIAGVRFNDYDNELMSTIAQRANQKKYEVVIINRAADSSTEKSKIDRVAGLLSCSPPDITFVNTESLISSK